ncbi:bifunctional hydroxymethylpyrimidine kinase/phosphomethylpyrimidine kinase [Sphingomonas rhizophila]|uniref:bifunctional hydroxymethylpyrimidine kinase/phosphomethylpyrimidine kinase n=1 Tax=Sphingomonas rhizophila TaxID=2071607 RepID=UPI003CCCCCD6
MKPARILTIAGSDSGGGAGIQADIKTVTMLGGHAMTAITAITAQNTEGVSGIHAVPAEMVLAQIDAVADDLGIDAIKIGMIGSAFTANLIAERLSLLENVPIVFDPVMVATSGATLADDATVAAFGRLMDVATIVTPNLPELRRLTDAEDEVASALQLVSKHRCAVLIKGGHEEGDALADALVEDDNITSWQGQRINTASNHGTGCTLASAIAFYLGCGCSLPQAVERGRLFVRMALHSAPGLGRGHGPLGQQAVRMDTGLGLRLNQVTVTGKDYAKMVAFYRALGLTQIVDAPDNNYARFETAGARPSRSRSIRRKRSASRPPSISNATISTTESNNWRARESPSNMVHETSRGCGARHGCAIPPATPFSSTAQVKPAAFRRGGCQAAGNPQEFGGRA